MQLKPGSRIKSAVSTVELMVVKTPAQDLDLRCGGTPMIPFDQASNPGAPAPEGQTLLGKRYATPDNTLELLCTKGGAGLLTLGTTLIEAKAAKPLPSSD